VKFVEEVVVEEFLPTYRSMLAGELRDRGLTQREVAETLGISQSAVSKYAHGDVERNERVAGEMSRVGALVETEVSIRRLEEADLLAQLHERAMPELAAHEGGVRVHDPESELRVRERVRGELRKGLRIVENTSGVATLIPNVGSNLVACLPDPGSIDDIVGVPGRIFDVKGRATVPGEPEFGVSEHVATVLLAAREGGSDARAAMNVRYDEAIVERLAAVGATTLEFDAERDPETAVTEAMDETGTADPDVLYHTGGYGIEPIVYLLGGEVADVIDLLRELL